MVELPEESHFKNRSTFNREGSEMMTDCWRFNSASSFQTSADLINFQPEDEFWCEDCQDKNLKKKKKFRLSTVKYG